MNRRLVIERYVRAHHGGLIALLMLIGALALQLGGTQPLRRATSDLLAARQAARLDQPAIVAADDPSAELAAFKQHFQRGERQTDWLVLLYATIDDAGMTWRSADYTTIDAAYPGLLEWKISFVLRGSTAQIESWIGDALLRLPVASIDRLSITRASAESLTDALKPSAPAKLLVGAPLEARVDMTLFIEKP